MLTRLTKEDRAYGGFIAQVLNREVADVRGDDHDRFAGLVQNLQKLSGLVLPSKATRLIDAEYPFLPETEEERLLAESIENELQLWPMQPRLRWEADKRTKLAIDPILKPEIIRKITFGTFRAFSSLFAIVGRDLLGRLRNCDSCGRWLFVRAADGDRPQRFCSAGCSKQWRANNPQYKEQQKKRAKEYREAEKNKAHKAKRSVGYVRPRRRQK